jgi:DNA-binding MarR family transcriptional regulator
MDGMTKKKKRTRSGEAVAQLMLEVAQCFFRIRAAGQKTGLVTSWGGGAFGFMRSLALLGPLTVPQIAQMRPTSRQRMQRLADELASEGIVEFVDNPKHRRSKLVRLTAKGNSRYRELNARLLAVAARLGGDLAEADVRGATEIVRCLSDEIKSALTTSRRASRALRIGGKNNLHPTRSARSLRRLGFFNSERS